MSIASTWILILMSYSSGYNKQPVSAMTSIPGFESHKDCAVAGDMARGLGDGTSQSISWVCIPQKQGDEANKEKW